jgi:hypothetical protein
MSNTPIELERFPGHIVLDSIYRSERSLVYRAREEATDKTVVIKQLGAGASARDIGRHRLE